MSEIIPPPLSRKGFPWIIEEEKKLISALQEGKTYDQIALLHGRSTRAIECHVIDMVMKWKEGGKSDEEIINNFHLDQIQITNAILQKREKIESISSRQLRIQPNLDTDSINSIRLQLNEINGKLDLLLGVFGRVQVIIPESKTKSEV